MTDRYIYFARPHGYKGVLKIGLSGCPERRMDALKSSYGMKFYLLDKIECNLGFSGSRAEKYTHALLSDYWFKDIKCKTGEETYEFFKISLSVARKAAKKALSNPFCRHGLKTPRTLGFSKKDRISNLGLDGGEIFILKRNGRTYIHKGFHMPKRRFIEDVETKEIKSVGVSSGIIRH